ncbi:MAG: metallopeptidase family protein [Candidatus Liptonbacteria bacterium]|nr:metallopeptidase family protein [Candidatus Liptonbacteria bacterium]
MTLEEFEKIVAEEADKIPEKFLKRLKNIVFVVEEEPSKELLEDMEIPEGEKLLGLFEGANLGEQGAGPWEMPGRIVIFKASTGEEAGETGEAVRSIVRDTIWHEVAHYLGMDELEVSQAEERREKRRPNSA